MNQVILMGRLGADPETRYTASGEQVTSLRLATSERWTNKAGEKQERTEWHSVVIWGNAAGVAEKYLHKGEQVLIQGQLRTREWESKDGAKRESTEVVISGGGGRLELIGGGKRETATDAENGKGYNERTGTYAPPGKPQHGKPDPFGDDIPFN